MRLCCLVLLFGLVFSGCKKKADAPAGKTGEKTQAASGQQQSGEPVELKVKWPVGNRYTERLTVDSSSQTTVAQAPKPVAQKVRMEQEYSLSVTREREKGGKELELEFQSTEMEVTSAGKTIMNVDTKGEADASEEKNPLAGSYRELVGAKIRYLLDQNNRVTKVEGLKEVIDKAVSRAPTQAKTMVRGMFSEDYFKQIVDYGKMMPPKPVKPGETWPVKTEIAMGPMGRIATELTYTFKGMEEHEKRNCALLEFTGTLSMRPGTNGAAAPTAMNIENGTMSGKAWFDPELGAMIDMNLEQNMTTKVTYTIPAQRFGTNRLAATSAAPQQPMQQTASTQTKQNINIKLVDLMAAPQ
jgi:hypothetical protein